LQFSAAAAARKQKRKLVSKPFNAACARNPLSKVKGVKTIRVSLDDKMTHVTHDPQVIDLAGIEEEISKLGYQANETPADPAAYEALPGCCKAGGGH
jgi:cation transport ATPase